MAHGALGRHEGTVHDEVVRSGAAHAANLPGIQHLHLGRRHEQKLLHALAVLRHPRPGGKPGCVPGTRAEAVAAGDPVPARLRHHLGRGHGGVGHNAMRCVGPDRPGHLPGHARPVGGEDRALVDDPRGAGIGLAQLLQHLDVGRQIDLDASQGPRQPELEQAGVGHFLEQRPRQLAVRLDLVGAGSDPGRQGLGGLQHGMVLGRHQIP